MVPNPQVCLEMFRSGGALGIKIAIYNYEILRNERLTIFDRQQGGVPHWRPGDAQQVHPRHHDARRVGRGRHLLRDAPPRKERFQEVQLEENSYTCWN